MPEPSPVGPAHTVGVLYPGYAAEDDYPLLDRLVGDTRFVVQHTSVGEDAHRVDALLDLGSAERLADGAEALRSSAPDAVLWGCTSGSFVFGPDGAREQADRLGRALGVPASSTSLGYLAAVRRLGVRRVAIAATYPDEVATSFADFLTAEGVEVLAVSGNGIVTATEVGTLGRDRVLDLARRGDHPDAEALLLPDTALHTVAWLAELEEAVGKPVLAANQVTAWEGLRLLGTLSPREQLGTLWRADPDPAGMRVAPS
ncbi:MAG: maleate cis-trans isomerase family protein [Marmoricola sp.]